MRLARLVAPACAIALLVLNPQTPFGVLHVIEPICRIVLDPTNKFTRVAAPGPVTAGGRLTAAVNTATITVNYDANFDANPAAKAAFQAAVDIWQTQVASSIAIVVSARYKDLVSPGLLAQAAPNGVLANFNASVHPSTLYPIPIVNKISLTDFNGAAHEIDAEFNSSANWYFGTDGITPANQIDFVSVALHELGHGLGFVGAGKVIGSVGTVREAASASANPPRYPYIYDAFTIDGAGTNLTNTSSYPDLSASLFNALQSGNLFWNGPAGVAASGLQPPRLYAPATWRPGSSYLHLDEASYTAGNINSLMTPDIGFSEAIHAPGPIMLGMFKDMGWELASCGFLLAKSGATIPTAGGTSVVNVTSNAGCEWTAASNALFITITGGASGSGNGTVTFSVEPNTGLSQRQGTLTIGGQIFTVTQAGTGPTLTLDRSSVQFAATTSGAAFVAQTTSQTVRIAQSGTGTVTWTATPSQPWITVTPTSGTGPATLTIGVAFAAGLPASGLSSGTIALDLSGAGNSAGPIGVGLTTVASGASVAPFGAVDTPADNALGVTGSLPVTGWALDDIDVRQVQIVRDPVAGEGAAPIFIGNAVLVEGARPDVAAGNPGRPRSTQAGWGYLMLTNFLPNQGNGTFRITAIAIDAENKSTVLGSRTITCTNSLATLPFGAIDTPGQGEVVSGNSYTNFGWVLSRGQHADPPHGGVVRVLLDGVFGASPGAWVSRSDLTALFPEATYPGVSNALGAIAIDTTTLANGVHTIAWIVTDNQNRTDGIGSRFFTVANSGLYADGPSTGSGQAPSTGSGQARGPLFAARDRGASSTSVRLEAPALLASERMTPASVRAAPVERRAILGRRGYDPSSPLRAYEAAANGRATIEGEELDRIELQLGSGGRLAGYMRVGGELGALPIGSHLDRTTGVFTWQPGAGFVRDYDLVFLRCEGANRLRSVAQGFSPANAGPAPADACTRREVRITLHPKRTNRVGPQVTIDTPDANAEVARSFLVGGWAIDRDADVGTGVETLHAWAYPVSSPGEPIFLGATACGGARPDVGALFGDRFAASGYGIVVDTLPPGAYDLAIFAWSSATNGFVPAKVVRVTIK